MTVEVSGERKREREEHRQWEKGKGMGMGKENGSGKMVEIRTVSDQAWEQRLGDIRCTAYRRAVDHAHLQISSEDEGVELNGEREGNLLECNTCSCPSA
jgi:hypothetical protein